MKKAFLIITVVLGITLCIVSCKKDHNNYYTMDNQNFVTQASSSNMFEIAAGNLAINNSTNTNIKAYGNHLVADHTQAATEMTTLANKKGWTIPTTMVNKDQSNYNTLAALQGTAFDKQFLNMMIASHQEAIILFQNAASDTGVPDDDLRSFAAGKLPALKEHLVTAQTLQTQVNNQ
jgi:putative membrane protein